MCREAEMWTPSGVSTLSGTIKEEVIDSTEIKI